MRGLHLADQDEPGFWEVRGYHDRGHPWREQRYRGTEMVATPRPRALAWRRAAVVAARDETPRARLAGAPPQPAPRR